MQLGKQRKQTSVWWTGFTARPVPAQPKFSPLFQGCSAQEAMQPLQRNRGQRWDLTSANTVKCQLRYSQLQSSNLTS